MATADKQPVLPTDHHTLSDSNKCCLCIPLRLGIILLGMWFMVSCIGYVIWYILIFSHVALFLVEMVLLSIQFCGGFIGFLGGVMQSRVLIFVFYIFNIYNVCLYIWGFIISIVNNDLGLFLAQLISFLLAIYWLLEVRKYYRTLSHGYGKL